MLKKYKDSGYNEELCFAEDEAGSFIGMAVMKLNSLDEKNQILKRGNDYSKIFDTTIVIREINPSEYFKYAQCISGETKYIRLKGMVWGTDENDIRGFLVGVNIEKVILTKNSNGTYTGEAFLRLHSSEDAKKAKTKNRETMEINEKKRFIIIEEISKKTFLLVELANMK